MVPPESVEAGRSVTCAPTSGMSFNSTAKYNHWLVRAQLNRVVSDVKAIRYYAFDALVEADRAGYERGALSDLYADAAGLVADWSGRRRSAEVASEPAWVTQAARAWRRQNGRTY